MSEKVSKWKGTFFFLRNYCLNVYNLSMKIKILEYVCILRESFVRTGGFMSALRIFTSKLIYKLIYSCLCIIDWRDQNLFKWSKINGFFLSTKHSFLKKVPFDLWTIQKKKKHNCSPYSDLSFWEFSQHLHIWWTFSNLLYIPLWQYHISNFLYKTIKAQH